jgi:hypothetical protein
LMILENISSNALLRTPSQSNFVLSMAYVIKLFKFVQILTDLSATFLSGKRMHLPIHHRSIRRDSLRKLIASLKTKNQISLNMKTVLLKL